MGIAVGQHFLLENSTEFPGSGKVPADDSDDQSGLRDYGPGGFRPDFLAPPHSSALALGRR